MITYGSTTLTSYNSIVKTEVYYYKSTSATSLSGGSWATTKPTWENGKYIWQKIRTVYEDGTHSESDPVNITGQQGATGTAAYSYKLNSSDSIIGKTKDGEYTIKKITFTATYKQGTGAVSAYSGRFKIESTTNGSTWKTEYTSSENESSKEFTIPDNIILIKCSLYQSDGTTVLLDIVTVPVVKDGVDAIGLRDSIPYYLASDKDTGITRLTQGWTRYRPQLTAEKKYLWVYYVSRYSEGSTEPELIEIKDDLVHFENNGDESPVETCVVDIEPKQDLNGYDHPWVGGAGKNLFDIDSAVDGFLAGNGTTITSPDANNMTSDFIPVVAGQTYIYTCIPTSTASPWTGYAFYSAKDMSTVVGNRIVVSALSATFTIPDGANYLRIGSRNLKNGNAQVEKGSVATKWEPYSNICPITGWTGAKVTRTGKNLGYLNARELTADGVTMISDGHGKITVTGTHTKTGWHGGYGHFTLPPGIYTITALAQGAVSQAGDSTVATLGIANHYLNIKQVGTVVKQTFTLTEPTEYGYSLWLPTGTFDLQLYAQIELGSTATDYEPYSGQTYDITFPSESGTVYGGQLNVTTGELVVDRAMVTFDGSNNESIVDTSRENANTAVWGGYESIGTAGVTFISDKLKSKAPQSSTAATGLWEVWCSALAPRMWFSVPKTLTTYAELRAYLAENPITVVYPLATPITYQLTSQEITMLCKENNIFADTGQTAISYYDNQTSTDPYVDYSLTSAFDASTDALDKAKEVAQDLADLGADLQAQIDGKIETWCQSTDPSTAWTTTELKNQHNGDLWYYTGESTSSYKNNTTYKYTASTNKWTAYSASTDLFDKIDAKTSIYYGKPSAVTQNLEVGDYLVDSIDGCSYRWDGSKWVKLTDYNAAIDAIEIGGKNLLRGTRTQDTSLGNYKQNVTAIDESLFGCTVFTSSVRWADIGFDFKKQILDRNLVKAGDSVTYSIWAKTDDTEPRNILGVWVGNYYSGTTIAVLSSEWTQYSKTFVITEEMLEATSAIQTRFECNTDCTEGKYIYWAAPKLERGTKATDWTPAPEDINSSISTAQTTADEALAATQPISSKTFTDIIGTVNDIANASFYFAKVHPTTYTDPWMVKMKIKASVPSDTNFRKTVDITIHGCRSNFISYDSIVANYNSNPIYYLNLYRATQAGIETNKKGHALGFGLRSSTSPIDTDKKRTFEVDLLEVDGCTVDWIDTPVKYADMDGTGSTNYVGCTELGITSNGQNATNNDNTYDRIKYSTIKAAEAIARYNIIVGTSAGYKHLKSGTPWDITYPILYADAALNANATGSSNYLTIPFTVTTTQNMTLTPYKPVYIEGTLEGTTFTPIDTTPLTQTVPTSDNGHQYILLGSAYSTTAINLEAEHPIYQFQNGNFVTVAEAASRIGANAENLLKATYAVCSTAAGTNTKTADCTNFELYEGARIQVTFTNANTASAPTLNINNTGAKAIYINKTVASDTNLLLWTAGSKMEFVYDGTGWIAQNVPYALYGTCSTGASTVAKDVTCNEAVICKGTTISVNMTHTNTAADATMNVGSTVAKDIYANGAKLTTNSRFNWRANTTQKFVFDGQVWRMDDDSVKALATAYITEIDDDGIMVHPEDDDTSGWAISDAIQLFKNGISYIKLWIENNIPKIRIGKEDQGHIILDNDSVDVRDGDDVLATFGENTRIGTENGTYLSLSSEGLIGSKNNLQYMQFLANGESETYGHATHFRADYGDSPQTYTHHISINESIKDYITFQFKTDDGLYGFTQQLEIKDSEETYTFVDSKSRYQVITRFISNSKDMTCYQTLTRLNSQAPKVRCTFRYIVTKQKQSPTFTLGTRVENSDQGLWSYSEGLNNIASGDFSYVEGENNTASGSYAHAEGRNVTASGLYSHAGGDSTIANWDYTFVHGYHLISNDDAQAVFGTYNKRYNRAAYLLIVGNGTGDEDEYRSDAFIVDYTGNIFLDINSSASSGTADAKLYDAITALGWQDDIINNM